MFSNCKNLYVAFSDGIFSLRIKELRVPKKVEIELECDYDLESETLYAVKWYRDNQEFYRYNADGKSMTFQQPGIRVNVSERKSNM